MPPRVPALGLEVYVWWDVGEALGDPIFKHGFWMYSPLYKLVLSKRFDQSRVATCYSVITVDESDCPFSVFFNMWGTYIGNPCASIGWISDLQHCNTMIDNVLVVPPVLITGQNIKTPLILKFLAAFHSFRISLPHYHFKVILNCTTHTHNIQSKPQWMSHHTLAEPHPSLIFLKRT